MSHDQAENGEADDRDDEALRQTIREEFKAARARGDISRRDIVKAGGLAGLTALVGGGGLAASTGTVGAASGDNGVEAAKAYLSTDTTVASGSGTTIPFDATEFDTEGNFDTTNAEYTVPSDGLYLITLNATVESPADGTRWVTNIQVNGGAYETHHFRHSGAAGERLSGSCTDIHHLLAGDVIEFVVFHDSGTDETLRGEAWATYATIYKLGSDGDDGGGSALEIEDSGNTVTSDASTLNFDSNLSATDDGSGYVTVNASSDASATNPIHEPDETPWNMIASRPMVSTEAKTYYVSRTEGDDTNGGESTSDPLATLQEVGDRLPYMLFHGIEVVVMTDTNGPATADSGGIYWPPIWCNFAGSESDIDIVAEGSNPANHLIDARGFSFSINGQEPSAAYLQNLMFDARPQTYDGIAYFDNCVFHSDTDTGLDQAFGGYVSNVICHDCTFGGDVEYIVKFDQGHRITLNQCDGAVGTALLRNGGVTAQTLFMNDCGNLSFPAYVSSPSSAALVIEDGQIAYPSSFA